ncbi:MAG: amino acid decarboxylase, partial [Clostridia bacterium]|nr:amino acid decarboxylase [Clostridia bacterium]
EDESYLSCKITAEKLEAFLQGEKTVPSAVYITSPDYLGNLTDIAPLASVCEKYGTVLAVDNAHGAYLKFAQGFTHPIDAGAHICCDSAHKTLPVLTGGAYLHISEKAPGIFSEGAKSALALFGTTSPSYLILASLDAANGYIADGFGRKLTELGEKLGAMKSRLAKKGYVFCGDEPAKLTFDAKAYGYSGFALSRQIENRGILCEFYDPDYVVLMLSPENGDGDLERIEAALGEIEKGGESFSPAPSFHSPKTVMEPGRAMLADSETVSVENAEGRILSSARVGCPPAVPIVFCGEQIDRQSIECMKYYGISSCRVVK